MTEPVHSNHAARCRVCGYTWTQNPRELPRCPDCQSQDICVSDTERPPLDRHDTDKDFVAVGDEYLHTHDPTRGD